MENKELVKSIDKVGPRTTKKEMEDLLKQAKEKLLQKESGKLTPKQQELKLPNSKELETWASDTRNHFATNISAVVNSYQELNETLDDLTETVDKKKKELKELYSIEEGFLDIATILEAKHNAKTTHEIEMGAQVEKHEKQEKELVEEYNRKLNDLNTFYKDKEEELKYKQKHAEREFNDAFDQSKRKQINELNVYIASKESDIKERLKELTEREQFVEKNKELIETFDKRLAEDLDAKIKTYVSNYELNHKREIERKDNELRTQVEIYESKLSSLKSELDKEIANNAELKLGIKEAQNKVQDIATIAVQNAKNETHIVRSTDKNV